MIDLRMPVFRRHDAILNCGSNLREANRITFLTKSPPATRRRVFAPPPIVVGQVVGSGSSYRKCKAVLDRDVPALDEARLIESLPKCGQHRFVGHWRSGAEVSDDRHRLLRPRRERPRGRCAAKCGQQFPPSDGDCHAPLPREGAKMQRYYTTSERPGSGHSAHKVRREITTGHSRRVFGHD